MKRASLATIPSLTIEDFLAGRELNFSYHNENQFAIYYSYKNAIVMALPLLLAGKDKPEFKPIRKIYLNCESHLALLQSCARIEIPTSSITNFQASDSANKLEKAFDLLFHEILKVYYDGLHLLEKHERNISHIKTFIRFRNRLKEDLFVSNPGLFTIEYRAKGDAEARANSITYKERQWRIIFFLANLIYYNYSGQDVDQAMKGKRSRPNKNVNKQITQRVSFTQLVLSALTDHGRGLINDPVYAMDRFYVRKNKLRFLFRNGLPQDYSKEELQNILPKVKAMIRKIHAGEEIFLPSKPHVLPPLPVTKSDESEPSSGFRAARDSARLPKDETERERSEIEGLKPSRKARSPASRKSSKRHLRRIIQV